VDCYVAGTTVTKGFGIQGNNTAAGLALTHFFTDVTAGTTSIGLINSSTVSNPGSSSISGTITGDDGNTGTWSASYSTSTAYVDGNGDTQQPESIGAVTLTGLTLTENVTYTLS